jgi:hypothetical protein
MGKKLKTKLKCSFHIHSLLAINCMTREEKCILDIAQMEIYQKLRQAVECHRQTRKWIMS